MPDANNTNGDAKEKGDEEKRPNVPDTSSKVFPVSFWWILAGTILIWLFLVALAIFHPNMEERWKFGAGSTLSVLVLVAIIIQAFIYKGQWDAMRATLAQHERASIQEQLHKEFERVVMVEQHGAMGRSLQASIIQIESMMEHNESVLKIMQGQLDTMREQTVISRKAVTAAELSAKAAQESAHTMAFVERPDITLVLKLDNLEVGKPIQMQFEVFNAGRTTAYNFGIHISGDWKKVPFDGVLDYGKPKPEATEPIRPQTRKYVHPEWNYRLTLEDLYSLQSRNVQLFIYGIMWYEDGGGQGYSEPFCRVYNPDAPNDPAECSASIRQKMIE